MKKVIAFFSVLMAVSCLFAAGAKWKSSDIFSAKKLNKLLETYNLTKTPVLVQRGDKVTYTLTVYNEGMHDGYAAERSEACRK